jgi:hypothetical protein
MLRHDTPCSTAQPKNSQPWGHLGSTKPGALEANRLRGSLTSLIAGAGDQLAAECYAREGESKQQR